MNFNKKWFELETNNNKKEPIKGNTIRKIKKFDISINQKFNINTL